MTTSRAPALSTGMNSSSRAASRKARTTRRSISSADSMARGFAAAPEPPASTPAALAGAQAVAAQLLGAVHVHLVRGMAAGARSLEQGGEPLEAGLGQESPAAPRSQVALARDGVTVAVRPQRVLRVVHVQAAQPVRPHDLDAA